MPGYLEYAICSNYPLSRDFRASLERHFGAATAFVNIAELRQASGSGLVRALRGIAASTVLIATEDAASAAMLPVLQLLAAVTRARRLGSVDESLEVRTFTRWQAAGRGLSLLLESCRAAFDLFLCRLALVRLMTTQRCIPAATSHRAVAYLNCNLWFGVKAGGSVGHISGVANALMDRGLKLALFAVGGRLLVDERARYVPLPPPGMLPMPVEMAYYRFGRRCIAQIRAELLRSPVDFIYQRLSLGNYSGVALSRELGVPLILEYNGSEAWVAKNWGRPLRFHSTAAMAEDVSIRHAHLIVTVSDVLRDELLARGVEPERIVSYPNCIDPKVFDPRRFSVADRLAVRAELGFAGEDVVATFIGTFGQWHGVEVLAQAIRRLIEEQRARLDALRLKFLLIGDGQKMPLVREAMAGVDASNYVRLTGLVPQQQAPRYLAASDVLLSPHVANADGTRFFGSPTKLFEYMAMGRGIVASELDQIGAILQPAVRVAPGGAECVGSPCESVALLVPPGDQERLMQAIVLMAANPQLRETLGENARRLALEHYTWSHHVEAILAGFERVRADQGQPVTAGLVA